MSATIEEAARRLNDRIDTIEDALEEVQTAAGETTVAAHVPLATTNHAVSHPQRW